MSDARIPSLPILFLLIFSFWAPQVHAAELAEPVIVPVVVPSAPAPVQAAPAKSSPGLTMLQALLKQKMDQDALEKKYRNEIEEDYERARKDTTKPNPRGDFTAATDSGPFSQTAKECGEAKQRDCAPSKFGGRTMCGLAVAKMIQCMSPSIGGQKDCGGGCGDGKMFVDCKNGQMAKCGYTKISPTDSRCKQAGAVLSYTKSETKRGKKYGHVEFVCGDNKYCSVYSAPHDQPWPRTPADACWFPKSGGGNTGSKK